MSDPVALWYWRHHAISFEIYDSERDAAGAAVYMEDYEQGSPIGIQFPDGRTVHLDDWPAYHEEEERRRAQEKADSAKRAATPRPTRKVLDPFEGRAVTVDDDEPVWLGKPAPGS